MSRRPKRLPWGRAFKIAAWTFVLGAAITFPSQSVISVLNPVVAFPVLLAIILLGVMFDIVGVAATRAHETPFLSRAAKKVPGSRTGLALVRQADAVATVCLDMVGDLAGTVSGALGAGVLARLAGIWHVPVLPMTALGIGAISAVNIGFKALSKAFAVRNADAVVAFVGRVLEFLPFSVIRPARSRKEERHL